MGVSGGDLNLETPTDELRNWGYWIGLLRNFVIRTLLLISLELWKLRGYDWLRREKTTKRCIQNICEEVYCEVSN